MKQKNLDVEEIEDNSLKSALEDLKDSVKSIAEGEKKSHKGFSCLK